MTVLWVQRKVKDWNKRNWWTMSVTLKLSPEKIKSYLFIYLLSCRNDKKCSGHLMCVGDGCLLCRVNPRKWSDPEALKEDWPYPLDRDLESLKKVEARMRTNDAGKYARTAGRDDWDIREGCTQPCHTCRSIHGHTCTHKVQVSWVCMKFQELVCSSFLCLNSSQEFRIVFLHKLEFEQTFTV